MLELNFLFFSISSGIELAILIDATRRQWDQRRTCPGMTFEIKYDGANEQFSPRCVYTRDTGLARFYLLRTVSFFLFLFLPLVYTRNSRLQNAANNARR